MQWTPIGTIHSPFHEPADMPVQPCGAQGVLGQIELLPEYAPGLRDIEGFSHLIVLYQFHRVTRSELLVTPFLDPCKHGIFATRAPTRPNPIGLSILQLNGVDGNRLEVENIDILDGTPLLDLKPYIPEFDRVDQARIGWLEKRQHLAATHRSDRRFT